MPPQFQPQRPVQPGPQSPSQVPPAPDAGGQYSAVPPLPAVPNDGHSGHNPYEFIFNPPPSKKRAGGFGSNSLLLRAGLIAGGLVVVMIVAAVVLSVAAPKSSNAGLTAIAQRQQELIRIADAATGQATGDDTRNFVSNVEVSLTSGQQQVVSYLAAHGVKLAPKILALDRDSTTDAALSAAASANNYDQAVTQTLTTQLQTYAGLLQTTYKQTANKSTKLLLQTRYSNVQLLLQQARSVAGDDTSDAS